MVGKNLTLMIGLPFSGKSTYVRQLLVRNPIQVIEGESIVIALKSEGINISNDNMEPVYKVERVMANTFMNRDLPIIVDNRNLLIEAIFLWRQIAEINGYKTMGRIIDTPLNICLERAEEENKNDHIFNHIKMCSERLDELKMMLGLKHQNILYNYEVINMEVDKWDFIK